MRVIRRTIGAGSLPILVLFAVFSHAAAGQPAPAEPYTLSKEDQKLLDQSDEIDRQLEQRGMVYHDAALEEYLARLAAPMLPKDSPAYVHWRIRILREAVINAQASPNGSIYVNTGLLAALENEDQLAGILAHEITHVARRHSFQFLKSFRKKTLGMELLSGGTTWFPYGGFMINTIFGNVSQFALVVSVLGYSRELEQEADDSVVPLMKAMARDPAQYARAFEVLEERLDPGPVPLFYRTHRKSERRAEIILRALQGKKVDKPGVDASYVVRMAPAIRRSFELDLIGRRFRTAVARARRLVEIAGGGAGDLCRLGEAYLALGPRSTEPSAQEKTDRGQNKAYSQTFKRTLEEDTAGLAGTPEGKAALDANRMRAGECFAKAAELDPGLAQPHFGLGALYQQEGKTQGALAEYRKYLELAPSGAADRRRAEQRIQTIESGATR